MESWVSLGGKEGRTNIRISAKPGIEPVALRLEGRDLTNCAHFPLASNWKNMHSYIPSTSLSLSPHPLKYMNFCLNIRIITISLRKNCHWLIPLCNLNGMYNPNILDADNSYNLNCNFTMTSQTTLTQIQTNLFFI